MEESKPWKKAIPTPMLVKLKPAPAANYVPDG